MVDSLLREEVREIDRRAIEEFGLPGVVLMENAGRGAAEFLFAQGIAGPVVVCAGKGNNGGDGFVIARHLDNRGVGVTVLLFTSAGDLRGDALTNFQVIEKSGLPIVPFSADATAAQVGEQLATADWIVDALLGTGTRGEVREPFATAIGEINSTAARVFAVDLPSGLDCDTGEPLGPCVRADHTATFVARKRGFDNPRSREFTGHVHVVDIGVPRVLLREL